MIRKKKDDKIQKLKTAPRGDPTLSIMHSFSLKGAFFVSYWYEKSDFGQK